MITIYRNCEDLRVRMIKLRVEEKTIRDNNRIGISALKLKNKRATNNRYHRNGYVAGRN